MLSEIYNSDRIKKKKKKILAVNSYWNATVVVFTIALDNNQKKLKLKR